MKTDNKSKPSAVGIDFGGTSVKIGSLSELLSEKEILEVINKIKYE